MLYGYQSKKINYTGIGLLWVVQILRNFFVHNMTSYCFLFYFIRIQIEIVTVLIGTIIMKSDI